VNDNCNYLPVPQNDLATAQKNEWNYANEKERKRVSRLTCRNGWLKETASKLAYQIVFLHKDLQEKILQFQFSLLWKTSEKAIVIVKQQHKIECHWNCVW
jgi:hypothetical protein